MATDWTPAHVDGLQQNRAWLEILKRLDTFANEADALIEDGDVFKHGKGIGMKKVIQFIVAAPVNLSAEADGTRKSFFRIKP